MSGNAGQLAASRLSVRENDSHFEFLFLQHYPKLLRFLMRLTGNQAQAEELSNEVFWKLSQQPKSWLLERDVGPWLYRTAFNAGIDAFRAASTRAKYEKNAVQNQTGSDGPLDLLLREENRQRVQRVLAQMKAERARLLVLRSLDTPYKELAEAMGVSVGSVGTLLNRAEAEFRKRYLALQEKEKAI